MKEVVPARAEKVTYYCDRCGVQRGVGFPTKMLRDMNDGPPVEFHLCDYCYVTFTEWLHETGSVVDGKTMMQARGLVK